MAKNTDEFRHLMLGRRLREAVLALEHGAELIDEGTIDLTNEEIELMAVVVAKTNELVAGYEDLLPQAV